MNTRQMRARWRGLRPRNGQRSSHIPAKLRRQILAADRHRCVACGSRHFLQIDHIIPWSLGGRATRWNLMTLCRSCNRAKSCYWVSPAGTVYYRPVNGYANLPRAAQILAAEQAARRNPARWLRSYL